MEKETAMLTGEVMATPTVVETAMPTEEVMATPTVVETAMPTEEVMATPTVAAKKASKAADHLVEVQRMLDQGTDGSPGPPADGH